MFVALGVICLLFTDRGSMGGNSVVYIRPSVSTPTFEPSDLWVDLDLLHVYGSWLEIKVKLQKSRSNQMSKCSCATLPLPRTTMGRIWSYEGSESVSVQIAVSRTSILNREQFYSVTLHLVYFIQYCAKWLSRRTYLKWPIFVSR